MLNRTTVPIVAAAAAAALGAACGARPATATEIVRTYYEQYVNLGHTELLDQLIAPDFVDHSSGGTGRASVQTSVDALHAAFDPLHFTIEDIVADGDLVAIRFVQTGTNVGSFFGRPPTGQPIEQRGMNLFRVEHGQITASWLAIDVATLRAAR